MGNIPPRIVRGHEPLTGPDELAALVSLVPDDGGWRNIRCLLNVAGGVLGGQLAALCLMGAAKEAAGFEPNSLHISFAHRSSHSSPFRIETEKVSDGKWLSHHDIRISQEHHVIAIASATLRSRVSRSADFGIRFDPEMPDVLRPENSAPRALTTRDADPLTIALVEGHPFIEIRGTPGYVPGDLNTDRASSYYWMRMPHSHGLEANTHYALLALASDFWYTLPLHGMGPKPRPSFMMTSLDHVIRFYNRPILYEWILVESRCTAIKEGLGELSAFYWDERGQLIATVSQQALLRNRPAV